MEGKCSQVSGQTYVPMFLPETFNPNLASQTFILVLDKTSYRINYKKIKSKKITLNKKIYQKISQRKRESDYHKERTHLKIVKYGEHL